MILDSEQIKNNKPISQWVTALVRHNVSYVIELHLAYNLYKYVRRSAYIGLSWILSGPIFL